MFRLRRRSQERVRRTILMEQVEDRTLFDAVSLIPEPPGISPIFGDVGCSQCFLDEAATPEFDAGVAEIVFVDEGVADHSQVIVELERQGIEARLVSSATDGLLQIAEALEAMSDVQSVHIVSHGEQAQLKLGNATITADELDAQYATALAAIGQALSDDGDIFIYGCRLAGNPEGQLFVDRFSALTGSDLAASDDVTGGSDSTVRSLDVASADWLLEYTTGKVTAFGAITSTLAAAISDNLLLEFANGTDSSGDGEVFIRGSFVEAGLRDQGTFGSQTSPPTGWHQRNNNTVTSLGFVANPQMDNWSTYDGDFFAPGTPVESFMIEINGDSGASLINNTSGDLEQNPGSLGTPSLVNHCGEDAVQVTWSGTSHGVLDVDRTYTLLENGLFILMETTLTNTSATGLTDVYFSHNVDPDNDVTIGAGYATTNTIVSQPSATTDVAHVSATQSANDGSYISFAAEDQRARVAHGGFNNTDASNIWNGVGLNSAVGASTSADQAISIGFKFDSIAAGESVDFSYVYILAGGSAIPEALECLHSPAVDLDGDDSSGVTGSGYKTIYAVGSSGVSVADTDADITDPDASQMSGATIALTNPQAGDSLAALTSDPGWPAGISVDASSTAVNVILTGNASMADYESALSLVQFSNSGSSPSLTDRLIEVRIEDADDLFSNVANTTVCFADIDATKEQTGTPIRNATNSGHWDVSFQITVENTGGVTLAGIDVTEDLDLGSNFGSAFVSAVSLSAGDLIFSGAGVAPTVNSSWNGSTVVEMLNDDGVLDPGDSFTLDFTATIDVSSASSLPLTNQVTVSADAPGASTVEDFATDLSDSGNDPTSNNDGAPGATAGNPDDPTPVTIRDIEVAKAFTSAVPSGNDGTFHVTYTLTVRNTGTEELSNLSLVDDLDTQFGNALVGIVSVGVTNINATSAPAENSGYTGAAGSDTLSGTAANALRPGQSFEVVLVVEIDPDAAGANFNAAGELENFAIASGDDSMGTVSDVSDDPSDASDVDSEGDGEGDDPTAIRLASLNVLKSAGAPVVARAVAGSTGNAGNWVIDYSLTVANTGNDIIDDLSLVEDLSSHFGSAFVQVIGAPMITLTNGSGVGVATGRSPAFDGDANVEIFDTTTSRLGVGDSVVVALRVEIDPDSAGAPLVNGTLENSAVASGTGSNLSPLSDVSDDPGDATNADSNSDGNPDDPTATSVADLAVTKSLGTVSAAASGEAGQFDVTYTFEVTNTGTEALSSLSLTDDLVGQLGTAFVGVTSVTVANVNATSAPTANGSYTGAAGSDMLSGAASDDVRPGQSFRVVLVVEVDPDGAAGATYNAGGELENQGVAAGDGEHGGSASTVSDDPLDLTDNDSDADGHPDDVTGLRIADMTVEKTVVSSSFASSGTSGNFDVTYDVTVTNTGNDSLSVLTLTENLQANFGGAFVGIVSQSGAPAVVIASTATNPIEINTGFNGNSDTQLVDNATGTNLLERGQSITIRVIAEVDPDASGAILVGNGLENQVDATANGTLAAISETSDDPSDSTDSNAAGDNDPDDPTLVYLSAIDLTKTVVGTPTQQADGTWDVEFNLIYANAGSTTLSNLVWQDDLSNVANLGATWLDTTGVSLDTSSVVGGTAPGLNSSWQTNPSANILDGPGTLASGDAIELNFTVNLDPDISGSTVSLLFNQATGSGEDPSMVTVSDASDDTANASNVDANSDNNPDDPTFVPIVDIGAAKRINSVNAVAGSTGVFDVEYVVVIENTGTVDLQNVQAVEALGGPSGHYGDGFGGVIVAPSIVTSSLSVGATLPTLVASWDGVGNINLFDGTSGRLRPGDSLTLRFTVRVDTVAGDSTVPTDFNNQVNVTADGVTGLAAADLSDEGTNPNGSNGDASEDDPTRLLIPQVRAAKDHGAFTRRADGAYTVPVTITVTNTGIVDVDSVQLIEDVAAQFDEGYISVQNPSVQANPSFAGTLPTLNASWAADTSLGVFTSAANQLKSGESFTFTFDAIVDPDAVDNVSQPMENQVAVEARGVKYDGTIVSVDDVSGNDTTTVDGIDDDDPTPLIIPEVITRKYILTQNVASSSTPGNVDVTYQFTLTNSGTVSLTNPSITDNWAAQFGGSFIRVVDGDLSDDVSAPAASGIGGNTSYNGNAAANILDAAGQLLPGETVTANVVVEIDPDNLTAVLTNGQILNQATGAGTYDPTPGIAGDELSHSDLSDDPSVAADNDINSDSNPDDPTPLSIASLNVEKVATSYAHAASTTLGNFDVRYDFTVVNTGTESLSNLSLMDDLVTQFGSAFVQVVEVSVSNVDAASAPAANLLYTGAAGSDLLNGAASDDVRSGQSFHVTLVVEVDPDNVGAVYNLNGELTNSATAAGDGEQGGNAIDLSDDPADNTNVDPNSDNNPDDPTTLRIGALNVLKSTSVPVPAASGTPGNYDIVYTLTVENIGNETLTDLTLTDDWAANFGGGFVGVLDTDLSDDLVGPATVSGNSSYSGGVADNMFAAGSSLAAGQRAMVSVTVEVDPDGGAGVLVNGALENSAVGSASISAGTISDASDDPSDVSDVDPNADNNPDDPTVVSFALIDVTKAIGVVPSPAASSTPGNYDVTYTFVVTNVGTESLSNLSLTDDLVTQFGGAFVQVVNVSVTNVDATNVPMANTSYDGTGGSDMLNGAATDDLRPGESFAVTLVIEVDPDSATANFNSNGQLQNSALAIGAGENGGTASDLSDDPANGANVDPNSDNNPDDPTTLQIGSLNVTKVAAAPVPAASNTAGNFDVTYTFTVENTGNETLTNLTLTDDWLGQFGGAYVGVVDTDLSDNVSGPATVTGNSAYNGAATDNMFAAGSSFAAGQTTTVTVTVEVDPNNSAANLVSGALVNTATGTAEASLGTVTDASDDPTDSTNVDPNSDNNPDDSTGISIAAIDVTKVITGTPIPAASKVAGNYDITYSFVVTNEGSEALSNLSLTDDLVTQFGGAFVQVVNVSVTNVGATSVPMANSSYDGTAASNMLNGAATDDLRPGESFAVTLVIEVDPDSATANFNSSGQLQNSALATGAGENGGTASDLSDDPANGADVDPNSDNNPDDPTTLQIGSLNVTKVAAVPVPAASNTAGNFDVTYTFTVENTGNETLADLTLTDDWLSQFGGAYVGVVDTDLSDNVSGPATVTGNSAYSGAATDNMFAAGSSLAAGQTATVTVTVEVDPNNSAANLVNGSLVNTATGTAEVSLGTVTDASDDPTDSTNVDPNSDNNPDDSTGISIAAIDVTKVITGTPIPAASNIAGNYDITYSFVVTNEGSESLSNLSLTDDLVSQFGGAFVQVVNVSVTNVDATNVPMANSSYDGTGGSDMLNGAATDDLRPGESFSVTLVIEVDPDSATANFNSNGQLENSALAIGAGENGGTASDLSDDPANGANVDPNSDNNPDDPTTLQIGSLNVTKVAAAPVPAASNTAGNFDVTYTFTVENTGNETLTNLTLTDDWLGQFGGAYVGVVDTDLSDNVSGPVTGNGAYSGAATDNMFAAGSSLAAGQTVTVTVAVEVDPNNSAANLVNGSLVNTATGSAEASLGTVTDASDDPADSTNVDPNSDNNPDDSTGISIAAIDVTKVITGAPIPAASNIAGNYDITYSFVVMNEGSEALSNLSLTDELVTQFGGAFVQVVNVSVTNVDATNVPMANSSYDGTGGSDMLNGAATDDLRPGESFSVTLVIEVDPDSATANFNSNGQLQNSALAIGADENGGTASDLSDDPANGANVDPNSDNNPDDPTRLRIGDIEVFKVAGSAQPSNQFSGASATFGNFVVPYTITMMNTGNDLLTDLQLVEDLGSEFGGGFVGIVGAPTIRVVNSSGTSSVAPAITPFDGDDNPHFFNSATSQLGIGDRVVVTINVEIDPDNATAILANGVLENTAVGSGTDSSGNTVTDDSDDPDDPDDPADLTSDDDPTSFFIAGIRITKDVTSVAPAASLVTGSYDVVYSLTVENTGTETLSSLSLTDDLASQFGGAFVQVVNVSVTNVDASSPPSPNSAYNGTAGSDMLLGAATDALASGESFVVTLVVEVDPDNSSANYNPDNELVNVANATGEGEHSGVTSADSDNPSDATNRDIDKDGHPDDPTTLTIGDLYVTKVISDVNPASAVAGATGTAGNFVVEYRLEIRNTGNDVIDNLQVSENLADQFGGAFVGIVGTPTIVVSNLSGSASVSASSATFDGGLATDLFDAETSQIDVGDSVRVTLLVEVDPDHSSAVLVNGTLQNSAVGSGMDSNNKSVSDNSDDPTDPTSDDDPTTFGVPNIAVTKSVTGLADADSGVTGNFDVTYTLTVTNTGTEALSSLSLVDDLATQFGGAFVQVVNVGVTNVDASRPPATNTDYAGTSGSDMLLGDAADRLEPGQSFVVSLVVEIDPDSATGVFNGNGALENSASVAGDGDSGTVQSVSDNPFDATDEDTDGDGQPDDGTEFFVGGLEVIKSAGTPTPSNQFAGASGDFGKFVIPYAITIYNSGNDVVRELSLVEELASQFGGALVGVVEGPTINATNLSGRTTVSENAASYDGATVVEIFNVATSQLGPGDTVTVVFNVEVDPSSPTAKLTDGQLVNSAVSKGIDSHGMVIDSSDDPSDPTGEDDPTETGIPAIAVTKTLAGSTFASSGAAGNYDVTYTMNVRNTGTETLSTLSLTDDLLSQIGGAFVRTVNVLVTNVNTTSVPAPNPGYDGSSATDMLIGSVTDELRPGEVFVVALVVEIDPDNADATYDVNGRLENSARASGTGESALATGNSDNPADLRDEDQDGDGQPDDETTFSVAGIELTKSLVELDAAVSGVTDNLDLTYEFTLTNVGNVALSDLSIVDDWLGNLGGAYVRVVDMDLSDDVNAATGSGIGGNADYTGTALENILDGLGSLNTGQSVSVQVTIELDPDNPRANLNSQGGLENQALGLGSSGGLTVSDLSDDPQDGTDEDVDGDNDPDDSTALYLKNLTIQKDDGGVTAVPGDVVSWTINYGNNGSTNSTGVVITEVVPDGVTYRPDDSTDGWVETAPGSGIYEFAIGELDAGESGTVVFAAVVDTPAASGIAQLFNTASIADDGTNGPDATNADNSDSDRTPIVAAPDYRISKDDGLSDVAPGDRISYTIVVSNVGNQDGQGVVVSDTFPAGLLTNVTANHAGTVDEANGTVTWNLGTLGAGESVTFVVDADVVDSVETGVVDVTNEAAVGDDGTNGPDPTPTDNVDSDTDTLIAAPNYEITKHNGVSGVTSSSMLRYVVNVRNVGNQDGTNLVVTDSYPTDLLTITSVSNGGAIDNVAGTVTWEIDALAVGEEIELTVSANVASVFASGTETLTNSVVVVDDGTNGPDPNTANNAARDVDVVLATPDYRISKDDGASVVASGEVVVYTISVANSGDQVGTGVVVTDTYPTELLSNLSVSHGGVVDATEGTITWEFASLASGEAIELTVSGLVTSDVPPGVVSLTNRVEVKDDGENGPDPTEDNSARDTNVLNGIAVPDYRIRKDDGVSSVTPGQLLTYQIDVANAGSRSGTGVSIVDTFDRQLLRNVSATGGGIVDQVAGTVTWTLPSLDVGGSASFEVTGEVVAIVPAGATMVSNRVSVSDDGTNGADPTESNNADVDNDVINSGVDYRIFKDDGATAVDLGDRLTYTIRVENVGTRNGTGVVVTDQFSPELFENVVASDGGTVDAMAGAIVWNLDLLNAGDTVSFTVTGDVVDYVGAGVDAITNTATVADDGGNGNDPTPGNNSATDINLITAAPDFSITKSDGVSVMRVGDSTTYTIVVEHVGTQDATGVTVVDSFPKEILTNVTASDGGVVDRVAGTVTWDLGTMRLGDVVTLTVTGDLPVSLPGRFTSLTNTVLVQDDGSNGRSEDPSDNTATDVNEIEHTVGPVYSITKDDGAISVSPGETATYTIALRNIGDEAGTEIVITDSLPALLGSVTASNGGVLDAESGTVRWNVASLLPGATVTFTVTGVVGTAPAGAQDITNTATASDSVNDAVQDTDTNALNAAPDHSITKSNDRESVRLGDSITYTIVVEHLGDQDATGVVVVDTFPTAVLSNVTASDGGIVDAVAGTITWMLGATSVGDVTTLTVNADVLTTIPESVMQLTNTVTVQNDGLNGPDPTPSNNTAVDRDQVLHTIGPIYTIEKSDGRDVVSPGDSVSYTITIRNIGDEPGSNIVLTDHLPELLGSVSASDGGVVDLESGTVIWRVGTLGENQSVQLTVTGIVASAPSGVEAISNSVTATDANGQTVNDTDTNELAAAPDLVITKDDGGGTASENRTTVYTLVASNDGNQDATGVVVRESLPPGTAFVSAESTVGWVDIGDGVFEFSVGQLAAGERRVLQFALTIVSRDESGIVLTNTAQVSDDGAGGADPNPANNSASETTPARLPIGVISKRSLLTTTSTGAYDGLTPL